MQAEDFRRVREHDLARLRLKRAEWLLRWEWAEEFHNYNGPEDLIRWFEWMKPYPCYLIPELIKPLAQLSEAKNKEILRSIDGSREYVYQYVDEYGAADYLFQNIYPVPQRMQVKRILDFGAGYGRQINLWSQLHPDLTYVSMDAIELPYCLQHFYYSHFDVLLHEYVKSPDDFHIEGFPGVYHVPTWRTDLLPNDFFDMIICVGVLPEISERLVYHMLQVFQNCLKPGGALYIRDHDLAAIYGHKLNLNKLLLERRFVLEFRPYFSDSWYALYGDHDFPPDVHGIPRIWRKPDPRYPPDCPLPHRQQQLANTHRSLGQRIRQRIVTVDQRLGGIARRVYHVLRGSRR
jgi:SAM-dependent methyltransferase